MTAPPTPVVLYPLAARAAGNAQPGPAHEPDPNDNAPSDAPAPGWHHPTRPKLLDLFCGAGGAAMGYHRAGFDVVGVDIEPQPRYPFEFIQADALKADLNGFDAVHASPPCQRFTALRTANPREYPDLISGTRTLLAGWGGTWVIENVPGAPLVDPIQFCGSSLGLGARCADGVWRQLRRHRLFESNTALSGTACAHVGYSLGVYGHGRWAPSATRRGAYQGSADEKRAAMDIDWMTRDEVAQAIPPAYTEHIGRQLLALLRAASTPNRPLRFSL